MSDETPAPGWYPAPHANNEQRYWDGNQWLEPAAPATDSPTVALPADGAPAGIFHAAEAAPKKKSKKGLIVAGSILAGVIVIGSVAGAVGGGNKPETADEKPAAIAPVAEEEPAEEEPAEEEPATMVTVPDVTGLTAGEAIVALTTAGLDTATSVPDPFAKVVSTDPTAGTEAEEGATITLMVEEKPKLTLSQQNAVGKAQSYLDFAGFSRTGLIGQLEYEGFSTEDATFGADNAGADWNAECAEKAKSYLEFSSFSREGLADQLAFEGFLATEIEFGLAAVGY